MFPSRNRFQRSIIGRFLFDDILTLRRVLDAMTHFLRHEAFVDVMTCLDVMASWRILDVMTCFGLHDELLYFMMCLGRHDVRCWLNIYAIFFKRRQIILIFDTHLNHCLFVLKCFDRYSSTPVWSSSIITRTWCSNNTGIVQLYICKYVQSTNHKEYILSPIQLVMYMYTI